MPSPCGKFLSFNFRRFSMGKVDDSVINLDKDNVLHSTVFTTTNAKNVSTRYNHIQTSDLLEIAQSVGFVPFNFAVMKKRKKSIEKGNLPETAKHFIALRPSDTVLEKFGLADKLNLNLGFGRVSRAWPATLLYNSHNGDSSALARTAIYDMICSNLSIISSHTFDQISFRHINVDMEEIKAAFKK